MIVNQQDMKKVILVAGVPRSGSTWLFNATRLIIERSNTPLHAAWCADYQADHPAPVHLVKVHRDEQAKAFSPTIILTTKRPTEDCIASLIRMGWVSGNDQAIRKAWAGHNKLYLFWKQRSDLEVDYDQIVNAPEAAITTIAKVLEVPLDDVTIADIARELRALQAPSGSTYDPKTLLHPNHRDEHGDSGQVVDPGHILDIVKA